MMPKSRAEDVTMPRYGHVKFWPPRRGTSSCPDEMTRSDPSRGGHRSRFQNLIRSDQGRPQTPSDQIRSEQGGGCVVL